MVPMSETTNLLPKKILVAVDGSDPSCRATSYAVALASLTRSRLLALTVVLLPLGASREITDRTREELSTKAKEIVEAVARQAETARLAGCEGRVLETDSSVVETITAFAIKEGVDLIVLGTKGVSGIPRLLLGSVAAGVVSFAHCPVLAVR